jgi:hypothetical protein
MTVYAFKKTGNKIHPIPDELFQKKTGSEPVIANYPQAKQFASGHSENGRGKHFRLFNG